LLDSFSTFHKIEHHHIQYLDIIIPASKVWTVTGSVLLETAPYIMPKGTDTVVCISALISVRMREYMETLLAAEGSDQLMEISVVPTDSTFTEVGESGLGGAVREIYIYMLIGYVFYSLQFNF